MKDKIKRASKGGHQHTRKTRTFLTEEIARAKNQTWSSSATVAALHFHLIIVLLLNSTRRSTMLSASFDQDAREEIVDKLHGALSAFRRERDELHRKKELAVERLRVAKEQQEATEKTIHDMQDKLNHISKSGSDDANKELKGIEKEVERLHREVQFQHTELLSKRNKLSQLNNDMKEGTQQREASVRSAQVVIKKRKEKTAASDNKRKEHGSRLTIPQQVARFKQDIEYEMDVDYILSKCPLLIEQNAAAIAMDACDFHRETETLHRLVDDYHRRLGESLGGANLDASSSIRNNFRSG